MPDVTDIAKSTLKVARKKGMPSVEKLKEGMPSAEKLKGPGGMATVGAALIALPFAAEGIAKLKGGSNGHAPTQLGKQAKEKAEEKAKDMVGDVADEKLKPSLPGKLGGLFGGGSDSNGGSDSEDDEATQAYGSGRRMPIQQSVDVAIPISDAYNLWTQFEEWPEFMHRVDSAQQNDDSSVSFTTKIWGITKEFQASIVEQRPDERIEWRVEEGLSHTGVVTFHSLAPRLTHIEVTLDVKPDSLIEKAGRGMRFAKRAVRGDLHRFKAYAEMEEHAESGGWRGTIDDGDVKSKTERKPSKPSRSKSKSTKSGSRNGSKSKSGSKSSKSRSRSKTGSKSRSRSKPGSKSRSRSKPGSKSSSRSKSS